MQATGYCRSLTQAAPGGSAELWRKPYHPAFLAVKRQRAGSRHCGSPYAHRYVLAWLGEGPETVFAAGAIRREYATRWRALPNQATCVGMMAWLAPDTYLTASSMVSLMVQRGENPKSRLAAVRSYS